MRIVAGEWRGRPIKVPRDDRVRPTADRAREAWMSILQRDLPGARVADLFAGSGALGLEALSRGAAFCDFVELTEAGIRCIQQNVVTFGAASRSDIHRADVFRFVQKESVPAWDMVFADPPYRLGLGERLAKLWLHAPFSRILGVEHEAHEEMPEGGDRRTYGSAGITIYRAPA